MELKTSEDLKRLASATENIVRLYKNQFSSARAFEILRSATPEEIAEITAIVDRLQEVGGVLLNEVMHTVHSVVGNTEPESTS